MDGSQVRVTWLVVGMGGGVASCKDEVQTQ